MGFMAVRAWMTNWPYKDQRTPCHTILFFHYVSFKDGVHIVRLGNNQMTKQPDDQKVHSCFKLICLFYFQENTNFI